MQTAHTLEASRDHLQPGRPRSISFHSLHFVLDQARRAPKQQRITAAQFNVLGGAVVLGVNGEDGSCEGKRNI